MCSQIEIQDAWDFVALELSDREIRRLVFLSRAERRNWLRDYDHPVKPSFRAFETVMNECSSEIRVVPVIG